MVRLLSAGATDLGLRRGNNEDAYLAMPELGFFAIADGMGGEAAGETASRYFIETAQAAFRSEVPSSEETNYALVQKVFSCSNKRIFEHAEQNPDDRGMGCTGDLLAFYRDRYVIGHVGDSRVYLLRDGSLRQLTRDHSLVQLQVDRGMLTPEEARNHPRKNILLRALGTDPAVSFDMLEGSGLNGDIFLLCSDGLTDMVDDAAIQDTLVSTETISQKVKNLIGTALSAGGRDNITVILCEVQMNGALESSSGAA
ncbi:Stp1/IreP family PP2C-type Ser/Thr phosphatase [Nitrosospira sp. Nsp13]|uniref:Stp1/IreP family PP2C-type Ser/Thr phosphatase n=1 Tax=Nitrosospira sp. Nsp13 TaxID=1855332 RepID=UPI000883C588|nr:Stp1/IreP family PP2C-type Ser/Thr phosphatase [Nitrosospira sp. Nsp13]SCX78142.1 protein phosphatase [Nitrosospira sp. Nsp13]